jgi:hypothetical protein
MMKYQIRTAKIQMNAMVEEVKRNGYQKTSSIE